MSGGQRGLVTEETTSVQVSPAGLGATMQPVSRFVSVLGLGAMLVGFAATLLSGTTLHVPGSPAVSLGAILTARAPASQMLMSGGIVLLALLPTVRVVLALWLYMRRGQMLNRLVAFVVLLELVFSTIVGG
jgi:hypothetical protein